MPRPASPKLQRFLYQQDHKRDREWQRRKADIERRDVNLTPEERRAQAEKDNNDLFGDAR